MNWTFFDFTAANVDFRDETISREETGFLIVSTVGNWHLKFKINVYCQRLSSFHHVHQKKDENCSSSYITHSVKAMK